MAACNKVLNTYELLEHIITFVPAGRILKMERGSKTWRNVIQDSVSITRARCVASKRLHSTHPEFGDPDPVYEVNSDFHINPALHPQDSWTVIGTSNSVPLHEQSFAITFEQFAGSEKPGPDEYLSNPPVCALGVIFTYPSPEDRLFRSHTRLLESSQGLRVKYLDSLVAEETIDKVWDKVEGFTLKEMENRCG